MLIPMLPIFLRDTVIVYPEGIVPDSDGGYSEVDGPGATYQVQICRHKDAGQTRREEDRNQIPTVMGVELVDILSPVDLGVTVPDQHIVRTKANGVALATPEIYTSQGAIEPPRGLSPFGRWTVTAVRKT